MSEHVDTIPKRASVDLGFPRSVIFGAAGLGAALLGNYVATTWVGNIVRNYIGAGWDIVALTVAVLLVVMAVLVPVLLALGVGKDLVPEKPVVGAVLAAAVPLASLVVVLCFLLFGMIPVVPLLLMDLLPASWLNGQGGLQYETWQLWAAPFALLLVLTGIEEATNYLRPRQATIFHLVLTVGLAALIPSTLLFDLSIRLHDPRI